MPKVAVSVGCSPWMAAMLVSISLASDTVGRLVSGALGHMLPNQVHNFHSVFFIVSLIISDFDKLSKLFILNIYTVS